MARKKPVGWRKEPVRHGLAAKGVKTATVRGVTYREDSGVMMEPLLKAEMEDSVRKIGGQRFQRMSTHRHKPDAIERAEWARSRGFNARVIRIGKGLFAVFTRQNKRLRELNKEGSGMFWG